MVKTQTEPYLATYLHQRGYARGLPISGVFELTARCNFNCPMCYVHQTGEKTGELTAAEKTAMQKALKDQRDPEIAGKKKKEYRSMYGYYNPVVIQMLRLRDARCGVSWTTFSHTPRKVLTNAGGPGQELFKNVRENSDIPRTISKVLFGKDIIPQ